MIARTASARHEGFARKDLCLRSRRRQATRALVALAFLLPAAMLSAAPRTVTKSQIRTDPPATTHIRLRDAIWDMIEREDMRRDVEPQHPLTDLIFQTRNRGTEIPSLCRFDNIAVEFAPVDRRERAADTRVRAVGLRAGSYFRFLVPPTSDYESISDFDRLPSDTDCSPLDGKEDSFFAATDEEVATDGYRALIALQQALRDGTAFPLDCDIPSAATRDCGKEILALDADGIRSAERCDADDRHRCFRIYGDDLVIAIIVTGRVYPGPPYGQIVSAKVGGLITLWHPRAD